LLNKILGNVITLCNSGLSPTKFKKHHQTTLDKNQPKHVPNRIPFNK